MTNATLHRRPINNLLFASTSSFAWQQPSPNLGGRERLGEMLSPSTFLRAPEAPRFGQKQACNSGYIWAWVKAEDESTENDWLHLSSQHPVQCASQPSPAPAPLTAFCAQQNGKIHSSLTKEAADNQRNGRGKQSWAQHGSLSVF